MNDETTFLALLTPPGRGALATIAVRGPRAWEVVQACLDQSVGNPAMNRPWLRRFASDGGPGEELVVSFPAEHQARVHCHGGSAACEAVCDALISQGATRLSAADWQAMASGDPCSLGATMLLPQALTERAALVLLDQSQGALTREVEQITALLLANHRDRAERRLADLLALAPLGLHLTTPWRVVIAGRPNAGKSSLLNALLGFQRSIISPHPGTTRDVVTAVTAFEGWPVELRDTAGLRESGDSIEAAGVNFTRREIHAADLLLLMIPANESDTELFDFELPRRTLVVRSKADLADATTTQPEEVAVSVITGVGLEVLAKRIVATLIPFNPPSGAAVPITEYQVASLQQARKFLDRDETAMAIDCLQQVSIGLPHRQIVGDVRGG